VTPIRTALDPAWWNEASPIEGAAQLLVWRDLGTATPEEVLLLDSMIVMCL
jgi:hypothetical protein